MSTRTAPTTIDLATGRRRSMTAAEAEKLRREAARQEQLTAASIQAGTHCESGNLLYDDGFCSSFFCTPCNTARKAG